MGQLSTRNSSVLQQHLISSVAGQEVHKQSQDKFRHRSHCMTFLSRDAPIPVPVPVPIPGLSTLYVHICMYILLVMTCLMSANHVPSLPVEPVVGNGYRLPIGESAGGGDGDGGRSLTESNSRQSVQSQSAAGG